MRIKCVFLLFVLVLVANGFEWKITETREKGMTLFNQAIRSSSQGNYIAEFKNPVFSEFNVFWLFIPKVTRAVYYQRLRKDGNLELALELYGVSGVTLRFVQNSDGCFVESPLYGVSARGGVFLRLYSLRALANDLYEKEKKYSDYEFGEMDYNGRACTRLDMAIPKEILDKPPSVYGLTGATANDFQEYLKTRPVHRTFLIDKGTSQIVSLKEYNIHGQCVNDMNLGNVDLVPDWGKHPGVFETPVNLMLTVGKTSDFLVWLEKHLHDKKENIKKTLPNRIRNGKAISN